MRGREDGGGAGRGERKGEAGGLHTPSVVKDGVIKFYLLREK
jgi:hypothetical protein